MYKVDNVDLIKLHKDRYERKAMYKVDFAVGYKIAQGTEGYV